MRQFSQEELVEKIRSERRHMNELYDEINTLKRENANLKDYVKSLKDECISCPDNQKETIDALRAALKRRETDILNNVKDILANQKHECLERNDSSGYDAICECEKHVDSLIKEVEQQWQR